MSVIFKWVILVVAGMGLGKVISLFSVPVGLAFCVFYFAMFFTLMLEDL